MSATEQSVSSTGATRRYRGLAHIYRTGGRIAVPGDVALCGYVKHSAGVDLGPAYEPTPAEVDDCVVCDDLYRGRHGQS